MSIDTVRQAVRDWVVSVTGLADINVIIANDNGDRPSLPYAMVYDVSPALTIGSDETTVGDESGDHDVKVKLYGYRNSIFGVQFFDDSDGSTVEDWCEDLRLSTIDPLVKLANQTNDIKVLDVGPTRNINALLDDTTWEQRREVEVTAGWTKVKETVVPAVEEVEIDGTIGDLDVTITVTE